MPFTPAARWSAAVLAVLASAALILQVCVAISVGASAEVPASAVLINLLSFFTILSNLQVAIVTISIAVAPAPNPLVDPSLLAATTVSIATVGLGYSLLLRHIWSPTGAQKVADVLLHDVIPVLFPIFWYVFCSARRALPTSRAWRWLFWPVAYILYSIARGAITGNYPYPFLDATTLGYPKVLGIVVLLLVVYLALAMLAATITRRAVRPPN